MTIAYVLDDTLDRPDGVQQYVLTLGQWMASHGHDVHYLVTSTLRTDIPNVHSFGPYVSLNFNGNRVRTPWPVASSKIAGLLDRIQPDVIHVQMPYSPFFAARLLQCASPHARILGTFHILPAGPWHTAANRLLALAIHGSSRRIQAVIAETRPAADFARAVYGHQAIVIPGPVDIGKFRSQERNTDPDAPVTVIFLGRLVTRKGVLELIAAFNGLPEPVAARSRLIIAGIGPLESRARRASRANPRISFRGFIPEPAKPAFLRDADIAVFPSTGAESFGIILIEAMAAGGPVVLGGDNPGYESVLGKDSGALVNPRDRAKFSSLLTRMITGPGDRKALFTRQQGLLSQFDIAVIGPQIETLYARPGSQKKALDR